MSRYGTLDKKSIVYILDGGLYTLKDEIKNPSRPNSVNLSEFYELEKILYKYGNNLLSMTNKVRFEKRLNTIRKKIHLWEESE